MTDTPAHHPFGPSALARRAACPGSYRMEKDMPDCPDLDGSRELGTTLHAAVVDQSLRDELELSHQRLLEVIDAIVEPYQTWDVASEERVSVVDLLTGNVLLFGTLDYRAINGTRAFLGDWKFGHIEVDAPIMNLQLGACALALHQTYGVTEVTAIIGQPTVRFEDHPTYTFTNFDAILANIEKIIQRCKQKALVLEAGKHCQYCNAKSICPAFSEYTAVVLREAQPVISQDNAHIYLQKARLAERLLGELKERIKAEVVNANGVYGNLVLVEKGGNRYIPSAMEAYTSLRQYFTPDEFMALCDLSPTTLEKVMAKKLQDRGEAKSAAEAKRMLAHMVRMPRGQSKRQVQVQGEVE